MSERNIKLIWSLTYDPAIERLVEESEKYSDGLPHGHFTADEAARIRSAFDEYRWACDLLDDRAEN